MKTKIVLLFFLVGVISLKGFSNNTDPNKQEEKKATKSKYDFNIFKLISIDTKHHKSDSTKAALVNLPKRKEE